MRIVVGPDVKIARMIPASLHPRHPGDWQQQLAQAITSPRELLETLGLDVSGAGAPLAAAAERAARGFALRVPASYVARMRRGDPADPLLRQVLPLGEELSEVAGFVPDPLGERTAVRASGLLQKYRGRALLIATGACAIHCRYCFRREFPYEQHLGGARLRSALAEIAADPSLVEIILSGGDPLTLTDARLATISDALSRVAHVKRLRIHTRLPVVLPARVSEGLQRWLSSLPWPVVVVLHANHPQEIDEEVRAACKRLAAAGATLLNQSVLLKDINDAVATLAELSEALFAAGVLPYYLHLLDRVRGSAHFEIAEGDARALMGELAARLPGYLVPRLVREAAGAASKLPLTPIFHGGL